MEENPVEWSLLQPVQFLRDLDGNLLPLHSSGWSGLLLIAFRVTLNVKAYGNSAQTN
jgi:hypothetical protein